MGDQVDTNPFNRSQRIGPAMRYALEQLKHEDEKNDGLVLTTAKDRDGGLVLTTRWLKQRSLQMSAFRRLAKHGLVELVQPHSNPHDPRADAWWDKAFLTEQGRAVLAVWALQHQAHLERMRAQKEKPWGG